MHDRRSDTRHTNDSRIAAARIAAGMSQAQLAERIGTTQQQLSRWETGARVPRVDVLKKIADALGVGVDVLI